MTGVQTCALPIYDGSCEIPDTGQESVEEGFRIQKNRRDMVQRHQSDSNQLELCSIHGKGRFPAVFHEFSLHITEVHHIRLDLCSKCKDLILILQARSSAVISVIPLCTAPVRKCYNRQTGHTDTIHGLKRRLVPCGGISASADRREVYL